MSFAIVYLRQNFSSSVIGVHRDVRKRRSISAYHKCSFLQVERSRAGTIRWGNEEGAGTRLTRLNYYLTLSCDHFLPLSWNRTEFSTDSIKIRLDDSSNLSHQILFKFHKTVSGWFSLVILALWLNYSIGIWKMLRLTAVLFIARLTFNVHQSIETFKREWKMWKSNVTQLARTALHCNKRRIIFRYFDISSWKYCNPKILQKFLTVK